MREKGQENLWKVLGIFCWSEGWNPANVGVIQYSMYSTREESHSGWGLHYCHTGVHTNVMAITVAISVALVAVTVLLQQCT